MDGREIQLGRALAGIRTQRELAELMDVNVKTVNNWENDRVSIKPAEAERLRQVLNERGGLARGDSPTRDDMLMALASASDADLIHALAQRMALLRSLIPEDTRSSTGDVETDKVLGFLTRAAQSMPSRDDNE